MDGKQMIDQLRAFSGRVLVPTRLPDNPYMPVDKDALVSWIESFGTDTVPVSVRAYNGLPDVLVVD